MTRRPPSADAPQLRPAGPADVPVLVDLARRIWRIHYPGILSPAQIDYMLDWMYDPARLIGELARGVCYDFVQIAGAPVGFAGYETSVEEMKLHKLYMHPDHQRRGLGSLLLRHVEGQARQAGCPQLLLTVNKANLNAIAAYHKHGFSIREDIVTDIGRGFVMDDFVMTKPLNAQEA